MDGNQIRTRCTYGAGLRPATIVLGLLAAVALEFTLFVPYALPAEAKPKRIHFAAGQTSATIEAKAESDDKGSVHEDYLLNAKAGQVLRLELKSEEPSARLLLFCPGDGQAEEMGERGGSVTLPQAGDYRILVTNRGGRPEAVGLLPLEPPLRRQPRRARLGGVEVDVVDTRDRLDGEARRVVVVDVGDLAVEGGEEVGREVEPVRQVIADPPVDLARRVRAHAVVLDERPWPEVAQAQGPKEVGEAVQGDARRGDPFERLRDVLARRVEVGETAVAVGEIGVEGHAVARAVEVGELEAGAPRGTAGLGGAGVGGVDQLRIEVQAEEGERRLQARHEVGPRADVAAPRPHQRL